MCRQPELHWSPPEKKAARKAFEAAYGRECRAIGSKLKQMMADDSDLHYLWRIHDFLSQQRREMDQKYDYRYSVLIQVFGRLFSEGWLTEADLASLDSDKVVRIRDLANFFSDGS